MWESRESDKQHVNKKSHKREQHDSSHYKTHEGYLEWDRWEGDEDEVETLSHVVSKMEVAEQHCDD